MKTPVNLAKVIADFDELQLKGVKYGLGAKNPLTRAAKDIKRCDCSDYARRVFYIGAGITIPDGSWNEREWCEKNLEEVPYSQALYPKKGELYVAFITAGKNGAGKVGHVWFVIQKDDDAIGETLESHGGVGINSRPANYGTLLRQVHKCFKVPTGVAVEAKPVVKEEEEPQLIIDSQDKLYPMLVKDGFVYVRLRDMLEAGGRKVIKATDKTDESPPRFYVRTGLVAE